MGWRGFPHEFTSAKRCHMSQHLSLVYMPIIQLSQIQISIYVTHIVKRESDQIGRIAETSPHTGTSAHIHKNGLHECMQKPRSTHTHKQYTPMQHTLHSWSLLSLPCHMLSITVWELPWVTVLPSQWVCKACTHPDCHLASAGFIKHQTGTDGVRTHVP